MEKKKLKKKYKQLQKDYEALKKYSDELFCENMRLKDKAFEQLSNNQILIGKEACIKLGKALSKAIYGTEEQ